MMIPSMIPLLSPEGYWGEKNNNFEVLFAQLVLETFAALNLAADPSPLIHSGGICKQPISPSIKNH